MSFSRTLWAGGWMPLCTQYKSCIELYRATPPVRHMLQYKTVFSCCTQDRLLIASYTSHTCGGTASCSALSQRRTVSSISL